MSNTRKPRAPRTPAALDFDAIRSRKATVTKKLPPIKIGGKPYTLKPSMPLAVTDYFAENAKADKGGNVSVMLTDMQLILSKLFGKDQWDEIREEIDLTEVPELFGEVFKIYGESVGESSASGES